MAASVSCSCGYRGPGVAVQGRDVCPICHAPVATPLPPAPIPTPIPTQRPSPVAAPARYRIPCPRGHLLKVTERMLGQQAVCPECNEIFVLDRTNSQEQRALQEQLEFERAEALGRVWLRRALWAAALLLACLAGLIVSGLLER